ncbi:MAG: IS1182 family transposase [Planctomycetes bacterium]|nr:IS1182 family transposase [Planctomycetota bacterium]MCB9889839.1 IS1182 family transposase [Planctomycetota bacterium]
MGGLFAPYEPHQQLLLPPSLRDWLPEDHLAYFVSDTVDQLEIGPILRTYRAGGSGNVAYHPRLMLKLLIFGYSTGVFSSRRIAKQIEENIAFKVLAAGHAPSHRSIARFRQEHISAFKELFVQVVQIAVASGMAKMGTLAIDGTKIKANASKHKAMSYGRMQQEEARLSREIQALLKAAGDIDALEDEEFGPDFRGDEVPEELKRRESRLRVIKEAKKRLEERKQQEDAAKIEADGQRDPAEKKRGAKRKHPLGKPKDTDQENFTDPDSRIVKDGSGAFQQGYNAQAAVDADSQMIVAAEVTQCAADSRELLPVLEEAMENTGATPDQLLADAGYKSEENLGELEDRGINAYIALGREGKGGQEIDPEKPATRRMQQKLRTNRGRKRYAARKRIVEPPFGWIKRCLGFRAFSLRGLQKVKGEWALVCLALNLRRLNPRIAW